MEARTKNRRLIVTDSGLVGLAPIMTQPGDAIIIIIGHGRPVVARQVNRANDPSANGAGDGHPVWHLIGEVFVDGMMEWEMMDRDVYSGRKRVGPVRFV
jgi:hypothetical protein